MPVGLAMDKRTICPLVSQSLFSILYKAEPFYRQNQPQGRTGSGTALRILDVWDAVPRSRSLAPVFQMELQRAQQVGVVAVAAGHDLRRRHGVQGTAANCRVTASRMTRVTSGRALMPPPMAMRCRSSTACSE